MAEPNVEQKKTRRLSIPSLSLSLFLFPSQSGGRADDTGAVVGRRKPGRQTQMAPRPR